MIKFKKITILITIFGLLNLYSYVMAQDLIIPKEKPKVSTEKKEKIELESEIIPIKKPLAEEKKRENTMLNN